ncbi:MAG: hypothetical protein ACRELV_11375 [Longimicrobiales bacterium]
MPESAFPILPWILIALWWIAILAILVWALRTFAGIADSVRRIAAALERREGHGGGGPPHD